MRTDPRSFENGPTILRERTEWDSNPRYAQGVHSISSAAPSAARSSVLNLGYCTYMEHSTKPDLHGVLVINKPRGPTSMSMVNLVRRKARKTKTGHAGTLDPLATGVLVLGIGKMTKRLGELMETQKSYTTVIDLSANTEGHDAETEPIPVEISKIPTEDEVVQAVLSFKGDIEQIPPSLSAIKVGGRRAYSIVRDGGEVNIQSRKVRVHEIRVTSFSWPLVTIEISCAKGFYVRSLARDLGKVLGTGGFCTIIHRTAVGPFTIDNAIQLEQLPEWLTQQDLISQHEVDQLLA